MKHNFDKSIIREYDIRGIYDETLTEKDALVFGHVFSKRLNKNKNVNICYDGRKSSLPLKNSLIKGLIEGGVNVCEIGLGPTPMLYHSCYYNKAEAGIMITGSHNPSNYNGFKVVKDNQPFYGDDLKKISIDALSYSLPRQKGIKQTIETKLDYIKELVLSLKQKRELKIGWDAGNGSAGEIMSEISKKINGKKILLFEKIDGNFPNHHPDPSNPKNLKDLIRVVKEEKLDIGIAFDGDGDRIGVIDNEGKIIPGDMLLLLFAKEILKEKRNAKIIGDVKCSQILFDHINSLGGKSIMSKTGHSLIKECMKKESADLAGEMSGHIFFADSYYGFDDAIYAALRLINLLSSSKKKLSEMINEFPKLYNTPEIRIECKESEKFKIIDEITKNQKKKKYINIDGIRVSTENGWWLIRASNTEAALVLRCEANSEKALNKLKKVLKKELEKIDSGIANQILA